MEGVEAHLEFFLVFTSDRWMDGWQPVERGFKVAVDTELVQIKRYYHI
jgi:hypothetical protein